MPEPPNPDKSDLQVYQYALMWFKGDIWPMGAPGDDFKEEFLMQAFTQRLKTQYSDDELEKWGEDKVPFHLGDTKVVIFKQTEVDRMKQIITPLLDAHQAIQDKIKEFQSKGQPDIYAEAR